MRCLEFEFCKTHQYLRYMSYSVLQHANDGKTIRIQTGVVSVTPLQPRAVADKQHAG